MLQNDSSPQICEEPSSSDPFYAEADDNSGYTHVELYSDGSYRSFVPEIDTEWMIDGRALKLKAGCAVMFFPSGNLQRCVLSESAKVVAFGVSVVIAAGMEVEFHPSGALRAFTVGAQPRLLFGTKKWKYRGVVYEAGTRLEMSADGSIVRVHEH